MRKECPKADGAYVSLRISWKMDGKCAPWLTEKYSLVWSSGDEVLDWAVSECHNDTML